MADYEDTDYEELEELEPEAIDTEEETSEEEASPVPAKTHRTAQDWVRDMRMSADVNGTTVGVPTDRVTPDLLLATSKKLLSVSRREAQQDQKDSLQFQRIYGPAEYFAEHVLRDGGKLGRSLLWKATNRGNLDFLQPGALDKHVTDVFYDSKLANMVDGSSPLELMDSAVKVTRLGEGGVGDLDSAPVEMRLVQPSFAGFIDPVRCYVEGTEILTDTGWVRVENINSSHKLRTLHDGEAHFDYQQKDIFQQSYPGELIGYNDSVISFRVTQYHRMYVKKEDEKEYKIVYASDLLDRMQEGEKFKVMLSEDPYALRVEHSLNLASFSKTNGYCMVYCPTVPGGLVFCRLGDSLGFWCGNSVDSYRIGLDAYFAKGAIKGSDGKLYRKMINAKTGKEELVDSVTAAKSKVTTADMFNSGTSSVYIMGGETGADIVPKKDVDYYLPRADELFSTSANLVPMLNGVKEMRLHMGCLHPATPVIVSKKGRLDVIRAGDMGNCCETLGVDNDSQEKMLPVVNTVSRFPSSRNCFRRVRLLSGRTVVTSDSHKWKVFRNDEPMLVRADKLKEGDVVYRSLYGALPTMRPFVLGKYVTSDFAYALGLACRNLSLTEKGRGLARIECPEDKLEAVEAALASIGGCAIDRYNHSGTWMLRVEKGKLMDWLVENVGCTRETRKVPSCILSSGVMQAASFIQGYTYRNDQTGQDLEEDAWILDIDNPILRDGLAIVLSRLATDSLYRDSRKHGLCMQLIPLEADKDGMAIDVVKSVEKEKAASYMVDIDVNDRLFAVANGIVTHNSKYALQAIPLDKPEPQLVRSLDEASGKDTQSLVGKYLGALYAKQGGTVVAVRKNKIDVLYDDGTKASVPLYENFPMNQKGYISSRPVVKAGQKFAKGDILSASNWTDDKGTAAIGKPLRTAWLSWGGGTYEDGIAISESCAEKLRSTTMYSTALDLDKSVKLGRTSFLSWKPDAFTKEQLENIGDDGIVKPGTVLKPGDPMILAVQTTEPGPGTLGKRILTDVSEKWEHDKPGLVTDIVKTRSGVKVLTTVSAPVEVGDKLSGCFDDKTEIFTDKGFKLFKDLEKTDKIAVLQEDGTARFELPLAYQADHYKGCMVEYRTRKVSMSVTPNHNVAFVPRYNYELGDTRLVKKTAAVVYGSRVYMQVSANFIRELSDRAEGSITLPRYAGEIKIDQYREKRLVNVFSRLDFAAFLGIYLAEGHCAKNDRQHWIRISQYDNVEGGKERCSTIAALLDRMGVEWHYYDHQYFMLSNWPIHKYVSKLGDSYEKYIPEEVFSCWTKEEIETLLDWFYMGDGEKTIQKGRSSRCATVSRRLADDLQRLYILVGRQSNVHSCFAENARKKRIYKISSSYNRFIEVGSKKEDWKIRDDYDGMIYCVTSSTGVVLTRRDGMVTWNGQSYGNKGTVSRIIPDDEMPQDKDGNPIDVLLSPLGLITRCYDEETEFRTKDGWKKGCDVKSMDILYTYDTRLGVWMWDTQYASMHSSDYEGEMYSYEDATVDFLVTVHHRMWAILDGKQGEYLVEDLYGKECFIPHVGNAFARLSPENWRKTSYKGKIYCPSVETGFVHIRRNGKVCCLGNTNSSQIHEALLGKVARKTGKPEIMPEFYKGNLTDYVTDRMKQARVHPEDDLINPANGKEIKGVLNGYSYMYKLKHLAESKMSARGTDKYTADDTPASGSYDGCFPSRQEIVTTRGNLSIATICEKRLPLAVLTWSEEAGWCYRSITDWFIRRAKVSDILHIRTEYNLASNGDGKWARHHTSMYPTKNHVLYRADMSKVFAGDVKVGDLLAGLGPDNTVVPVRVTSISEYSHDKPGVTEIPVYDFTVDEAHKYTLAGGNLVSNSKRYGNLEISAMVGHNAFAALQDAKQIRGQANADFWREVRTGGIPTMPGEPTIHKKFFSTLKAAGVNVRKTQKGVSVFALTNKDIGELAGPREVKSKDTFDAKTFSPMDGGLFGQDIFGINGDKWGYIQLDEPLPNPVMEDPIMRLLRLKKGDFEAIISGQKEVDGMKSASDLKERLKHIDLEKEAEQAKKEFKSSTKSKRDDALKRYRAVEIMRRNGVSPDEYMLDKIPVLPPYFRPVTAHSGLTMVADSNYLYAQLMDARDDLREAKDLPDEYSQWARASIYRKWKELVGLYEPENPKLKSKSVKGLLGWALGTGASPKSSAFQRKVLGTSVDTVGRGVVVADPRVKLNEIGMPEKMAFDVMAPFLQRELVRSGYSPVDALKMVKNRDPRAKRELLKVMETHPVQMNRAPTLHKLSIIGAKPVLVSGHAIHVNPSIVVPLAMDFDGDTIQGEWLVVFESKELAKNLNKYKISAKKFLTSSLFGVSYDDAGKVWRKVDENSKEEEEMLSKKEAGRFSTAVCSPSELPVIPESKKVEGRVTEWDVVPGVYTYTLGLDGACVLAPVTKVSRHAGLKMFDCKLSACGLYPHVVTASSDHSLITFNPETMALEKTRPEDSVGRLVPRVRRSCNNTADTIVQRIQLDNVYNLDRDFGIILGMLLGDGWITKQGQCIIAACDPSVQREILRITDKETTSLPVLSETLVHSYEAGEGRFSSSNAQRIDLHTKYSFGQALRERIGHGAENKRIPAECLAASYAHMSGILMGLLATDGSVTYAEGTSAKKAKAKTVTIHTTSPELRDGIRTLCTRLGIRTSVTPYMGKNSVFECYAVVLSIVDLAREARKRPASYVIPHDRKNETLQRIVKDVEECATLRRSPEIVPMPSCLTAEFTYAKVGTGSVLSEARSRGYLNRKIAVEMAEKLKKVDWDKFTEFSGLAKTAKRGHTPAMAKEFISSWISIVEDDELGWEKVEEVTPSACTEGWDCTVPGPYTFTLFDGTVVQDTVNLHVPVSDAAREDTRNKMFPEKVLVAMRNRKIAYKPEKEYQQGLYIATRMKEDKRPRIFDTFEEARAALRRGEIDVDDPIVINKK